MSESVRRHPTILTVAEHAGVSPMTVSRVLSGAKNVRPELAQRVQKSVAALGYRRNEQARSLRPGQRSGLIGVAITNIANPYYAEFLLGAEEEVSRSGRRLLIGGTSEDPAREGVLVSDFIGRQVEGLIVVPTGARRHLLRDSLGDVPLVLASRAVSGLRADTVLLADVQASYDETAALLQQGHRRIGFLGTMSSVFTGQRRREGYELAHQDAGVEPAPDLMLTGQQDVSSAEQAMRGLLAGDDPPTAVFCANNRNAIGAVRALLTHRGGAGVTVVSFDNFELADLLPLRLTIIDHDARELGRQAAAMLLQRVEGQAVDDPPRTIELPTRTLRYDGTGN